MKIQNWCIVIFLCCIPFTGCGVVAGTLIDTSLNIATYPFKEYVFLGSYKYDNDWEDPYHPAQIEKDPGEKLIGLTVSGGGSRSAYFFACVMEELSKIPVSPGSQRTYVDETDYISSVSGGSLASCYFCLKKYHPEYKHSKEEFFSNFKKDMLRNFESEALIKYTVGGLWALDLFTYYDRGDLMANVWDKDFLHDATFQDLAKAEDAGAPALIMNGTILNNGLKFVFSNIPDNRFNRSQLFANVRNAAFIHYTTTESYVPFQTYGFETINSDIRPYPLSKAVVASAAVPCLLGPVTVKDYSKKGRLLNIVDGGVYDNHGLESMMQIFTEYLDRHPGKPAEIIIIDGSGYFQEDDTNADDYTVAYYANRPISISWLRTKGYMEYVFQKAREFKNKDGVQPYKNLTFKLISLYGVLPSQERPQYFADVQDPVLQKLLRPDIATKEFFEKVISIQTRFTLGKDDIEAIQKSAAQVVDKFKQNVDK